MPRPRNKKTPHRKTLKRLGFKHRMQGWNLDPRKIVAKVSSRKSVTRAAGGISEVHRSKVIASASSSETEETFLVSVIAINGKPTIGSITSSLPILASQEELHNEFQSNEVSEEGIEESEESIAELEVGFEELAGNSEGQLLTLTKDELLDLYRQKKERSNIVLDLAKLANRYKLSNECVRSIFPLLRKQAAGSIDDVPNSFEDYISKLGIYRMFTLHFSWQCSRCEFSRGNGIQNPQLWTRSIMLPRKAPLPCPNSHVWERSMTHFVTIGIRGLLQCILPKLFNFIQMEKMDCKALRKLREKVGFRHGDIILNLCTDGIPISNSSAGAAWPLLATIYGTSRRLQRGLGLLLLGFYRASQHISNEEMKEFFRPVLDDILETEKNPIVWRDGDDSIMSTRVYVMNVFADTPARSQVMDLMSFNARFGCHYCLHDQPGPYFSKQRAEKRTHEQHMHCVENIEMDPIFGVKGASVLTKLPYFDLIQGCPPDPMHTVFLGVFKLMLNIWLDSTNHKQPFYIRPDRQEILSYEFTNIKPPSRISRPPRPLSQRAHFKASEFHFWGLYAAPVLIRDYLPSAYYLHYEDLANGIALLSRTTVSAEDLDAGRSYLRDFVNEFYNLYNDRKFHRYNIHLLLHLPDYVELYGAIPNFSMTAFESKMFHLKGFVTGSQYPSSQIVKKYLTEVVCNLEESFAHQESSCMVKVSQEDELINPVVIEIHKDRPRIPLWTYLYRTDLLLFHELISAGGVKIRGSRISTATRKCNHIYWVGEDKVIEINVFVLDTTTGKKYMQGLIHHVWPVNSYQPMQHIKRSEGEPMPGLIPLEGSIQPGYKIKHRGQSILPVTEYVEFGRFLNNVDLNSD